MKKKLLGVLTAALLACTLVGGISACSGEEKPEGAEIKKIGAELLDGKIANFMGAQGLGVLDKNQSSGTVATLGGGKLTAKPLSSFSTVAVSENSNEESGTQKKNELVKTTEDGPHDVYFHDAGEGKQSYKDLNKQFGEHHHEGAECSNVDCDKISDEIESQEQSGAAKTIVSLDARVSKLYNYGDWTFFSVTSAVEGEVRINTIMNKTGRQTVNVGGEDVLVYGGDGVACSETGVSFIFVEDGAIPVKRIENDKYFHTANYWCDDYNQSYVTDNATGKTYSLSQFPRIYSVENGVIKVYNVDANGGFDYYQPRVENDRLVCQQIELPEKNEVGIPEYYYGNVLKTDIYGNHVIESRNQINEAAAVDQMYDQNGEKKIGDNMIVSAILSSVQAEIRNKNAEMGNFFANRYTQSNKYHMGSDGRIYRLNFKGNLSEVSLSVLNENCEWQSVEDTAEATFEGNNGYILWSYSQNMSIRDYFLLTKVSGGYAYYSTAAATDGGMVWDSHFMGDRDLDYGEYCGVVKIPVDGPETGESARYAHLEEFEQYIAKYGMKFTGRYKAFLIGDTQVLYLLGSEAGSGDMLLKDVTTGETKELGFGYFRHHNDRYSIYIEGEGWLSLKEEIDFENFTDPFSAEPKNYDGGLDAYFAFISEQIKE